MKPILLGLSNPHSDDPAHDLYPWPDRSTGWRIWKMLNERTGASKQDYARAFSRCNVAMWGVPKIDRGATAVLFGEEVRRIVSKSVGGRIRKILIHPQEIDGAIYRCVPHPSGRCRFYNDPASRELVALLLEDLYGQTRKTEKKQHS